MILSLRQRHRRIFVAIGCLLPIAFVIGIIGRKSVPELGSLPAELSQSSQHFTAIGEAETGWFTNAPVRVQFWREQESGRTAAGFSSDPSFVKPDLIVYWARSAGAAETELPPDATLLGAFVAGPLVLPAEAAAAPGQIVLYSLADQEVVAVSKPGLFTKLNN